MFSFENIFWENIFCYLFRSENMKLLTFKVLVGWLRWRLVSTEEGWCLECAMVWVLDVKGGLKRWAVDGKCFMPFRLAFVLTKHFRLKIFLAKINYWLFWCLANILKMILKPFSNVCSALKIINIFTLPHC
jgi:hypothetical protein